MPTKLSAVWFPENERVISTMIAVNMSIVGCIVGFYSPALFVTAPMVEEGFPFEIEKSKSQLRQEIARMMMVYGVTESFIFVLIAFFFKENKGHLFGGADYSSIAFTGLDDK